MDPNDSFSWLTAMGFAFLTFNSGMAIYRSKGDAGSIAFVAISYLDLLLLFYCLRLYEKAGQNASQKNIIKGAVWFLTTLLTVMFSYKVAALMPMPVAVIVWAMSAATILGGFYAFFLYQEVAPEPNK
jgi:FlaA1/EpsC-like NDP-sugar epimerase